MAKKILIVGFGYTAQYLSDLLINAGHTVTATTRNLVKIRHWRNSNIKLIHFNHQHHALNLADYDWILSSVPPTNNGTDPILQTIKNQLISNRNHLLWVGYLSSTSVYGDHHGKWVDETSKPINPGSRGIRRLKTEASWLSLFNHFNLPIHLFRLAGIYGPDRNNLIKILAGKRHSIIKPGQIFSRIHVEDISRALFESMTHPTPGEIYNLADDLPCAAEFVDEYATQLLHRPPLIKIPYREASLSDQVRSFYQASRKVSNQKFKIKFKFELRYPTYKEGLKVLHNAMSERM